MLAKNGPKMSGWRKDLVLGETVRAADAKMVGKKRDNILMRNLWCLLTSSEMVAQTRFYGVLYFAFCVPLRWLSGNTHEMLNYPVGVPKEQQWCAKSMNRVADHLLTVIEQIIEEPSLFLSKVYMMNIFKIFMVKIIFQTN